MVVNDEPRPLAAQVELDPLSLGPGGRLGEEGQLADDPTEGLVERGGRFTDPARANVEQLGSVSVDGCEVAVDVELVSRDDVGADPVRRDRPAVPRQALDRPACGARGPKAASEDGAPRNEQARSRPVGAEYRTQPVDGRVGAKRRVVREACGFAVDREVGGARQSLVAACKADGPQVTERVGLADEQGPPGGVRLSGIVTVRRAVEPHRDGLVRCGRAVGVILDARRPRCVEPQEDATGGLERRHHGLRLDDDERRAVVALRFQREAVGLGVADGRVSVDQRVVEEGVRLEDRARRQRSPAQQQRAALGDRGHAVASHRSGGGHREADRERGAFPQEQVERWRGRGLAARLGHGPGRGQGGRQQCGPQPVACSAQFDPGRRVRQNPGSSRVPARPEPNMETMGRSGQSRPPRGKKTGPGRGADESRGPYWPRLAETRGEGPGERHPRHLRRAARALAE